MRKLVAFLLFQSWWLLLLAAAGGLLLAAAALAEGSPVLAAIGGGCTTLAGALAVMRRYIGENVLFLRQSLWRLVNPSENPQEIVDQLRKKIQWGMPFPLRTVKNRAVLIIHEGTTTPTLEFFPFNMEIYLPTAVLRGVDLSNFDLHQGILVQANLEGANLARANLQSANLSGANLQNADLRGANLWGANLRGARVAGVLLDQDTVLPDGSGVIPYGGAALPAGETALQRFVVGDWMLDARMNKPDWRKW